MHYCLIEMPLSIAIAQKSTILINFKFFISPKNANVLVQSSIQLPTSTSSSSSIVMISGGPLGPDLGFAVAEAEEVWSLKENHRIFENIGFFGPSCLDW